jgi:hypothetical protein
MSTCPSCCSPDVIGFTLTPAAEPMRFRSCRSCEHRWWEHQPSGDELVLSDVLERIATA